jgi:hypothetical protein
MNLREFLLNAAYAFTPGKPRLTYRLARAVIRASLFRRRDLRYLDLTLGYDCNLRCSHCFAVSLKREGARLMSPADYAQQCLASTDRDFMEKYLSRTFTAPSLPLPWHEVFDLPAGGAR